MKTSIEKQISKIASVRILILRHNDYLCNKLNFDIEKQSKYLGDILLFFKETCGVIFSKKKISTKSYTSCFSYYISLLQSIYIQQDLINELIFIFKCGNKINFLKNDPNYTKNREIRNELIGHPVRKVIDRHNKNASIESESISSGLKNNKLLSSSIFATIEDPDTLVYIRSHLNSNYQSEIIRISRQEIIERHRVFVLQSLEKICRGISKTLNDYCKRLIALRNQAISSEDLNNDFPKILHHVDCIFKKFNNNHKLYHPSLISVCFDTRNKHLRYRNMINKYIKELIVNLNFDIAYIQAFPNDIKRSNRKKHSIKVILPGDEKEETSSNDAVITISPSRIDNSHYEISKLFDRNDYRYCVLIINLMKDKHSANPIIVEELSNMLENFDDEVEYYSSLELIKETLDDPEETP